MTLPEQIGKVAESMKGSPGLLAVIFLQMMTLAILYFGAQANAERQQSREMALIQRCMQANNGN